MRSEARPPLTAGLLAASLPPLIISRDPLFYSTACIIAFGLALGTVLSLLVVPVIYSFFFNVRAASAARALKVPEAHEVTAG